MQTADVVNIQFSTENLLKLIDVIKNGIIEERLTADDQEEIWNALTWNKTNPDNKELIKWLFTGWWIHQNIIVDDANKEHKEHKEPYF